MINYDFMGFNNDSNDILLIERYKPNKYHPFLYHLNKIDWFIFGSLTWEYAERRIESQWAQKRRIEDFKSLLRLFCGRFKIRLKNLPFYQATEFGKSGGLHFHFLIAKAGCEGLCPQTCSQFLKNMWDWRHKKIGGEEIGLGTADVKSYDDALAHPGVAYCLKREFDETGNERERYDHLSKGLVKLIKIGHVTSRKVEPKNIEVIDLF